MNAESAWSIILDLARGGVQLSTWSKTRGFGPIFTAEGRNDRIWMTSSGITRDRWIDVTQFRAIYDCWDAYKAGERWASAQQQPQWNKAYTRGLLHSWELGRLGFLSAAAADDLQPDPTSGLDARVAVERTIKARRGRAAFRDALIEAYDGRCAMTGCAIRDVLEAAHIHPYRGEHTNHVNNGLLLRADVHTLFDLHLISIVPATMTVVIARSLRTSEYAFLDGVMLRPRRNGTHPISLTALEDHLRTHRTRQLVETHDP